VRPKPDSTLADPQPIIVDLRRELAECRAERDKAQRKLDKKKTELAEALAQRTATAEVLQVINSSPGDLTPVFDAMLEKAMRLCEANYGHLVTYDGERFVAAAAYGEGLGVEWTKRRIGVPFQAVPDGPLRRLLEGEDSSQIADIADTDAFRAGDPVARSLVENAGARTVLAIALRQADVLLGAIVIYRHQVRLFTDKQIALLQNFAAQAVIAMENARLITETREALEQQTATAEVLQVINSSPGDLASVFDAILEKAHSLCGSAIGSLAVYDGRHFRAIAERGWPESFAALVRQPYRGNTVHERLLRGERYVHIPDAVAAAAELSDPVGDAFFRETGVRTLLQVSLRKDNELLGYISAHRLELRPFSDKEIALLENFAAQAVIAMENARLLGELRQRTDDVQEALEYQTAISDVLKVISRSTFDLQPVLDTLCETAARLCGASTARIALQRDDSYRYVSSFVGRAISPEWDAMAREMRFTAGRGTVDAHC